MTDKEREIWETHLRHECVPDCPHHAPGLSGLSSGPGSRKGLQNPFEWWHAPTSMAAMAKKAEQDGATKRDPKLARYLDMRLKRLKEKEHPTYDYQKLGHPIRRRQTE